MGALTYGRTTPGPYIPYYGEFMYGGYYAGVYQSQYLIVAPASTEFVGQYNTVYSSCEALVSSGYTDWHMPYGAMYPQMAGASNGPGWPPSQYYNVSLSSLRNYWVRNGYPLTPSSKLTSVYIFATGAFDLNYGTSIFSCRAIRLQTPI